MDKIHGVKSQEKHGVVYYNPKIGSVVVAVSLLGPPLELCEQNLPSILC